MHINFQIMHLKKAGNMFMHVAMDACFFWIFDIYLKFIYVIQVLVYNSVAFCVFATSAPN